jgi:hypothetical protein
MQISRIVATIVTLVGVAAVSPAHAGERYSFPSPGGLQLSVAPAPSFTAPPVAAGSFVYGSVQPYRHEAPLPPPLPLSGYGGGDPYRSLSHALTSAAYSNYAADYARIFAPGYAVSAWTGRLFGVIEQGHGAVDAWTGAAYGLSRARGPHGSSTPDLTLMPQFRAHPELEQGPAFSREN